MQIPPEEPHTASDSLAIVQLAFDTAHRQSLAGPVVLFDRRSVRYELAKRIITSVLDEGERDPTRLALHALDEVEASLINAAA